MLHLLWKQRHRIHRSIRKAQGWTGDLLSKTPLPVSAKILLSDMLFLALEAFIFHTQTYQRWRTRRIGRGRIHALLKQQRQTSAPPVMPSAPAEDMWQSVSPLPMTNATLDVIVPVYNGYDTTLRCLYSVLTSKNTTAYELIVINDASTDHALSARLYELAGRNLFTLLENDRNLGFVATVNRGMQLHPERDVVLLNADTEVRGNWLDRLRAHAISGKKTGSVTPFSNNAGICSYPCFLTNNAPVEEADALAAAANAGQSVHLPTAVGFCMFIPRDCLKEVGYFDTESFGRGYGEENDFCLRASQLGYVHLLAGDVYVRHYGGASFGADKAPREKAAWKLLKRRYRDYPRKVAAFIQEDPALPLRRALDLARLAERKRERNVLMISHQAGGGTQKHILDTITRLEKEEATGCFLLTPSATAPGMLALTHPDITDTPNLLFNLYREHEALEAALHDLGITRLQVHHLLGFAEGMAEFIQRIAAQLGTGYEVVLHDYYFICPRINLVTEENRYCGEPDLAGCETCIATRSSHAGETPVWLWRERAQNFLQRATRVIAPDADTATRFNTYFPRLQIELRSHESGFTGYADLSRPLQPGESLKIGILGALSPIKGAQVVENMLRDATRRDLPIEFVLIGYSDYAPLNHAQPRWHVTGAYQENEVEGLLRTHRPHLLFFPSLWPETYCYTLSYAFRHHIPPVAFDLGAQASRIKAQGMGELLPLDVADQPAKINDTLLTLATQSPRP